MAFEINWPEWEAKFVDDVKAKLSVLLNQGEKPEAICSDLVVSNLSFGTEVLYRYYSYYFILFLLI